MRTAGPWAAFVSALLLIFAPAVVPVRSQAPTAEAVIAQVRTALGGEGRIAAVRSLIINGRTRQVRGDNLVPIEFEIQIEMPDKYSRRDEIPAQDTDPATNGFNGDLLVQIPAPPPPVARAGGPPPPSPEQQATARRARALTLKQDVTRVMLGMFAGSMQSYPVTFAYVGQAEAPQGKADVLDVRGPANFAARLFIDAQTHLPIMLTWQAPAGAAGRPGGPAGRPAGAPPGAAAPPAGAPAAPPAGAAAAPPQGRPGGAAPAPEQRLYFADYREVDGLRLPFRIRRAAGADTTEETTFDRFRINARTDPRRFESLN